MARVIAKTRMAKAIAANSGGTKDSDALPPGHMRLYSYYRPSLTAGLYGIEAKQEVLDNSGVSHEIYNYKGQSRPTTYTPSLQQFEVVGPQFNIDTSKINTYYPPTGGTAEGQILPHIVFDDPHYPWLRKAGTLAPSLGLPVDPGMPTEGASANLNLVPWFAIVVFDPEDLILNASEAQALGIGSSGLNVYNANSLPANGVYTMAVKEYSALPHRVRYDVDSDWTGIKADSSQTSIIFPTWDQFQVLFGSTSEVSSTPPYPTLESFKYLSHVRQINTVGFPDAGVQEEGFFSVCMSARTGDYTTQTRKTQIVHLVSIEHLDATLKAPDTPPPKRLGLVSLFNWTYSVVPESPSFVDDMNNLANTMQMLKPPQPVIDSVLSAAKQASDAALQSAGKSLASRFDAGYTINRWRTPTGDETVCFNRGPLTPILVPQHPQDPANPSKDEWVGMSMHGKEFQIFDAACGVMDLTYSNAWNLGRIAAISDGPFNAALLRLRSFIYNNAASLTRAFVNNVTPSSVIKGQVPSLVGGIHDITGNKFQGDVSRINPPTKNMVAPPLTHPDVAPVFAGAINAQVDSATSAGQQIYNEFNQDPAANTDWVSVFSWVQDSLFFANMPMHYLFQDPSFIKGPPDPTLPAGAPSLPPEALRFFHIDDTWMDCFVDGALSCANHLEPVFDRTRVRMKEVFNYYFATPIAEAGMVPIIPKSGFVIRSAVVKAVPDLRISATTGYGTDPICRLKKLDDFTIFCLFDCPLQDIAKIVLAQPAHQQRFALAASIELVGSPATPTLTFKGRQMFTSLPPAVPPSASWGPLNEDGQTVVQNSVVQSFWNPITRRINTQNIAGAVNNWVTTSVKQKYGAQYYTEVTPNSAEMGLQLNDPAYQLTINGPSSGGKSKPAVVPRAFWINNKEDPLNDNSVMVTSPLPHAPAAPFNMREVPVRPLAQTPIIATVQQVARATATTSVASSLRPDPHTESQQIKSRTVVVPTVMQPPQPPAAPKLHSSQVMPTRPNVSLMANIPMSVSQPRDTLPPKTPLFQALVCVDYRAPPPLPKMSPGILYAPLDYIPTKTRMLLDLVIVIRRINPSMQTPWQLLSIDVELPQSDGKGDKIAGSSNGIREPMIAATGYSGHARMASNLRFVPTLYSDTNDSKSAIFPGPVLGVRLLPRSGNAGATIPITNDGRTDEVTVCLSTVNVPAVVDSKMRIQTAQPGNKQGPVVGGKCEVVLRETYLINGKETAVVTNSGGLFPLYAIKRDVDDGK